MARLNVLELIIGKKGTGKTEYTKRVNQHDAKVLYIMGNDHPKFRHMRSIPLDNLKMLKYWKGGHIRIVGDSDEVFDAVNKYVKNAKICFEDATKYIPFILPKRILRAIIDSKQCNNDIQLQFHSLRRVPMDLYDNADYLTLFKTRDVQKNVSKVPDYIWEHWERIQKHKSPYYHETIELE